MTPLHKLTGTAKILDGVVYHMLRCSTSIVVCSGTSTSIVIKSNVVASMFDGLSFFVDSSRDRALGDS
jgi:hypothetical protein